LSKFASGLHKKLSLLVQRKFRPRFKAKTPAKEHSPDKSIDVNLIKLLAKKKFGLPKQGSGQSSPDYSKSSARPSSMKVIIPRQTKLTAERATFSRAKYDVATCTDFDVKSVCSFDLDINKKCEKVYNAFPEQFQQDAEISCLDISDEELENIVESRSNFIDGKRDKMIMSTRFVANVDMDGVIKNVSDRIVDHLVRNVCYEMFDSTLIANLVDLDLR